MFKGRFTCFLLLFLCTHPIFAQADRAEINGTVTDSSGAVVQKAKVEVVSPANGLIRETTSNARGLYQIPGLPIGTYKVSIIKEGFKPLEFPNVEIAIGEPRTIDARLQVGSVTETAVLQAAGGFLLLFPPIPRRHRQRRLEPPIPGQGRRGTEAHRKHKLPTVLTVRQVGSPAGTPIRC